MSRAALALAALALLSCRVRPPFSCADTSQCGPGGVCVDQACAFPDATCASGWRFDPSAAARARQCVPVEDAGMPPSVADMAEPPAVDLAASDSGTCAAAAGQPCCSATPEEAAGLPSPPAAPKGLGRCPPELACAQGQCSAHASCQDGSYNSGAAAITVVYCVPLH